MFGNHPAISEMLQSLQTEKEKSSVQSSYSTSLQNDDPRWMRINEERFEYIGEVDEEEDYIRYETSLSAELLDAPRFHSFQFFKTIDEKESDQNISNKTDLPTKKI
jgi:hypothetical protein